MNKPNNYDNTTTASFDRAQIGPHVAGIKGVEETQSKAGRDMIVVSIDFAKEDEQGGYFTTVFDNDTRDDKKWPFQATHYILTTDANGNTSRSFKAFCTSFEESNNVKIKWGDDFAKQFKGKKIGVMFGEVEEEYNGQVNMRTRIRWFFDQHKIDTQTAPLPKLLYKEAAASTDNGDWMNVPNGQEALPFA